MASTTFKSLVDTTCDSVAGYKQASEKADNPSLKQALQQHCSQREQTLQQMNAELQRQGDELVTSGTFSGSAHRVWASVTAAFEDNDEAAAERVEEGEDYLAGKFREALDSDDLQAGERQIVLDAWVDDAGHLVPTKNQAPQADRALGASPAAGGFTTHIDATMRAYGLVIAFDDFETDWQYRNDGGGQFSGRLDNLPTTRVTGRAFGILPAGMLDAFMPSDMASYAEQFMQRLADSDDGRGARLAMTLTDRAADNHLTFEGEGDLLDNFFVRFGVKLMNGRVLPNGEQLAGIRRLIDDGLGAFEQDRKRRSRINAGEENCALR